MISEKEYSLIFKNRRKPNILLRFIKIVSMFVVLFFVFYFLLNYPAYYKKITFKPNETKINTIDKNPKVERSDEKPKPTSRIYIKNLPNDHLTIPTLKITAPVNWNIPLDNIYTELENGLVNLEGTALPDMIGNSFIFGHSSNYAWAPGNYNQIFATLPNINIGNDIVINYNNQQFLYRVKNTKIVTPKDLSVIAPTEKPIITLMTCVPVGTSINRFIVQAELVEGLVYSDPDHKNLDLNYLPKVL